MIFVAAPAYGQRALVTIDTTGEPDHGPTMTLSRSDGGDWIPVAGAVEIPWGSTVVPDVAVPLERQVTYRLVAADGTTWTTPPLRISSVSTPVGPACLITHPVTGEVVPVAIVTWASETRDGQSVELEIPGRPERIRLPGVEMWPTSQPEIMTFTAADRTVLDGLLADGEILLIRTVCPDYPDTYVGLTSRTIARPFRKGPIRIHTLDASHHSHPSLDIRAMGDTLQDLADAVPGTLQDIADRWPGTLLDIATADLKSGV